MVTLIVSSVFVYSGGSAYIPFRSLRRPPLLTPPWDFARLLHPPAVSFSLRLRLRPLITSGTILCHAMFTKSHVTLSTVSYLTLPQFFPDSAILYYVLQTATLLFQYVKYYTLYSRTVSSDPTFFQRDRVPYRYIIVSAVSRNPAQIDRRTLLENLALVLLAIDELVDAGKILEIDPSAIANRVLMRGADARQPQASDMTVQQVRLR